jgi:fructose-1,6-bisphosphatase/inositol monophosphatase family enzyme
MNISREELWNLQQSSARLIEDVGGYVYDAWLKDDYTVSYKDLRDAATEIDVEAENRLRNGLHELFSDAGFIVEEGENSEQAEYNWIIDPIDQTKKFIGKLPLFYIQVGLLDAAGEPILGHIYNPVSKQLFSASRNNGAYLNSKKFVSHTRDDLDEAIVDINFSGNTDLEWKMPKLERLAQNFYRIQISSDAFGLYILTGAIDCFVTLANVKSLEDILPRIIVMREAGLCAELAELDGRNMWVVASKTLRDKTLNLLRS